MTSWSQLLDGWRERTRLAPLAFSSMRTSRGTVAAWSLLSLVLVLIGCGGSDHNIRTVHEAVETFDSSRVARALLTRVAGIPLVTAALLDVSDVSLSKSKIAVIDRMGNHVFIFNRANGTLEADFGGRRARTPSGLSDPVRVLWRPDGSLLLVDMTHPTRLRVFSSKGEFLGPFKFQPAKPAAAATMIGDMVVLGLVDPVSASHRGRVVGGDGEGRVLPLDACPRNPMLDSSRNARGMLASFALLDVAVVGDTVYCAEGVSPVVGVQLLNGELLPSRRIAPQWYRPPTDRTFSGVESDMLRYQSEWTYHARIFPIHSDLVSVFLVSATDNASTVFRLFGCPRLETPDRCWQAESPLRPLGVTSDGEVLLLERTGAGPETFTIGFYRLESR